MRKLMPFEGFKCSYILSSEWIPILLEANSDLLRKRLHQRHESVINRCTLIKRCPFGDCGQIMLVSDQAVRPHTLNAEQKSDPQTVVCGKGHSVCLRCSLEGHAPCTCELYKCWSDRVKDELKKSGVKETTKGDDVANALWIVSLLLILDLSSQLIFLIFWTTCNGMFRRLTRSRVPVAQA